MSVNIREAISLMQINAGAQIIRARYLDREGSTSSQSYSFKNVLNLDLDVGDYVIVQSRDFYAMVEVTDIDVMPSKVSCGLDQLKHVACKVDLRQLELTLDAEDRAAHAMAMSEVNERLVKLESQLGGSRMSAVRHILIGSGHETVNAADEAK